MRLAARLSLFVLAAVSGPACRGGEGRAPEAWTAPPPPIRCAYGGVRPTTFVGTAPNALVVTDLDGDGRPDAIVARPEAHVVAVARGLGDGTFADPVSVRVEGTPVALAAFDLDGDRRPEVAILELGLPRVSVLAADASGPRIVAGAPLVGPPPNARPVLAVGDLDGDGAAEIIVTDESARAVVVLGGLRGGALGPPRIVHVGPAAPRAVAVGDFDGNHTVDLALAGDDGVTFLGGDGRGGFTPVPRAPVRPPPPDAPSALAAFAVPGLGRDGLAIRTDEGAHVLFGVGAGAIHVGGAADGRASNQALVAADLDRDGVPDLVDVSTEAGAISVRRLDRAAVLGAPQPSPRPPRPPRVRELDESDAVEVLRSHDLVPAGARPIAAAVADLDADGAPDIVTLDREGFVGAVMNHGDGTFREVARFGVPISVAQMLIADVDGDGDGDVVALSSGSQSGERVTALLRRGEGAIPVVTPLRRPTYAVGVVDADGDGRRDLLTLRGTDRPLGAVIEVHRGFGDGRFDREGASFPAPPHSALAAFGDVDGDRLADVVLGASTGEILFVRNVRTGFAPPVVVGQLPSEAGGLWIDDLDRDGRPEIFAKCATPGREQGVAVLTAASTGPTTCVELRHAAPGALAAARDRVAPLGAESALPLDALTVDDLDGDGATDVLGGVGPDFVVVPGRGDRSHAAPLRHHLRPRDNVFSQPFVITVTSGERVHGIGVLRGTHGQPPALAVATVSDVAILPRLCWRPR